MDFVKFSDQHEFIYHNRIFKQNTPTLQLHYHNVLELNFITGGKCNYFIDEKSYDVEPGDIIIVPEGTLHKLNSISDDLSYILIYCRKRHIPYSVIDYLKKIPYLYRNPNISNEIKNILDAIETEFNNPDDFSNNAILLHVQMLFFLLVRNLDTITPVKSNNVHVKGILQYIQKNFSQNVTLEELSDVFSLSTEHISRIFKKETGFNFIEYLTTVRMHEAEKLLLADKKMPISEIASKCGFNDSNYFSGRFKKLYKISPSQFRKK